MKVKKMNDKQLERIVTDQLEYKTLEEFFEQFDLTPFEIVKAVFESSLIDEEILEALTPSDIEV